MIGKLILYSVATLVVLLVWLLVWLASRRETRKEAKVQAALVGQCLADGIVQVNGPTATFDPPLVIQPGKSVELHFTVPLEKSDRTVKN